jgi:hypothetical protein
VDGYNIIFAWEELAKLAKGDLDAARRRLCDILSSYAGFTKTKLVVVFDGYKQKGNPGEKSQFHNRIGFLLFNRHSSISRCLHDHYSVSESGVRDFTSPSFSLERSFAA